MFIFVGYWFLASVIIDCVEVLHSGSWFNCGTGLHDVTWTVSAVFDELLRQHKRRGVV